MPVTNKSTAANALTFSEKLRAVPLLRALVPMVAGITLGSLVDIPLYIWAVCTVVCAVVAWAAGRGSRRRSRRGRESGRGRDGIATLYIALAILFFGAALARVHTPQPVLPQGERIQMEIRITDNPVHRGGRSMHTSGVVTGWRTENDPLSPHTIGDTLPADAGKWNRAREKLLVSFDTMYRFEAGDRLVFRGYVNPIGGKADQDSTNITTTDSYTHLMHARGYTGRTYISQYSQPAVSPIKSKSPGARIKKLQAGAAERLWRLGTGNAGNGNAGTDNAGNGNTGTGAGSDGITMAEGIAVAAAMSTGDRAGITPELRRTYSRTGASHLLAVSGLHVGIVFLVINALLYLLPLARGGHIAKNIAAIAAIWLYAALTGLSPSAARAAFMFTGAQAALAMSAMRNPANIMCGTAIVMLAVKPGLLFDISFQLSFVAVAAILAWFDPLYRLVESRWRGLNALWATLIVGLVASVATMPLVSHTFGVFSPAGVVLNPIVITTAYLVVTFSLIWIVAPIPFLEPVFRWLVGGPAWLQNRVVALTAEVPGATIEYTLPLGAVFAVYALMIAVTVWLAARSSSSPSPRHSRSSPRRR